MRERVEVPSFADDSDPVVIGVSETGESIMIAQGADGGDPWTGDRIVFAPENAERVIEAIRKAVGSMR